jgi:hypothetical protein
MTVWPRTLRVLALMMCVGVIASAALAQALPDPPQNPPAGGAAPPPGGRQGQRPGRGLPPGLGDGAGNAQIQQLLDALVVSKAQGALQLSNEQFNQFLPRLLALQNLQRQHRNQRNKMLGDIRALIGPNAPQEVEDSAIGAATRALDDLEAQMQQDEQRALAAIDASLTVRQRARFRMFQEQMERQKIDLLLQARGGGPQPPPGPGRAASQPVSAPGRGGRL